MFQTLHHYEAIITNRTTQLKYKWVQERYPVTAEDSTKRALLFGIEADNTRNMQSLYGDDIKRLDPRANPTDLRDKWRKQYQAPALDTNKGKNPHEACA